jgi:hypothetical protein
MGKIGYSKLLTREEPGEVQIQQPQLLLPASSHSCNKSQLTSLKLGRIVETRKGASKITFAILALHYKHIFIALGSNRLQ